MHRSLVVREILKTIFSHIEEDSALAAVLTTCRIFFQAGVAQLYQELDGQSLVEFTRVFLSYDDELVPDKLRRIARYTKCVRAINVDLRGASEEDEKSRDLEDELYRNVQTITLATSLSGPLFPGLRRVALCLLQPAHMQYLSCFLCPVLDCITVYTAQWVANEDSSCAITALSLLIQSLHERCPLLQTLRLPIRGICHHETQGSPSVAALLASLVRSLQRLHVLAADVYALDTPALLALSQHAGLEHLEIGHWSSFVHDEGLEGVDEIKTIDSKTLFPALRRFVHHRISGDTLLELLQILPRKLAEIELTLDPADVDNSVLKRISERMRHRFKKLRQCQIYLGDNSGDTSPQTFSMNAFLPLSACPQIRVFKLECDYYWDRTSLEISDEHIIIFSQAWPRLRELLITWPAKKSVTGLKKPSDISLLALKELATNCPRLHHVHLTYVDVGDVPLRPIFQAQHIGPIVHVQLEWSSNISNPDDLALFFSMIWPNIRLGGRAVLLPEWLPVIKGLKLLRRRLNVVEGVEVDDNNAAEERTEEREEEEQLADEAIADEEEEEEENSEEEEDDNRIAAGVVAKAPAKGSKADEEDDSDSHGSDSE